MGWKRSTYIKHRSEGFKGLFPGKLALVEASAMAGMLVKYDEDFILCSQIEKAMGLDQKVTMPKLNIPKFANIIG